MKIKRYHGNAIPMRLSGAYDFFNQPITSWAAWALWFTLKLSEDDPDPGLLQYTINNGITLNGPEANWEITGAFCRTALQPDILYSWDVQGRDPDGRPITFKKGKLILEPVVTKSS